MNDDAWGLDEPLEGSGAAGDLAWRETYVVFFESAARPTLTQLEAAVGNAGRRMVMENLQANDDGHFKSVMVQAPEDNAALDIRYEEGEAITERVMTLANQMREELDDSQMAQLLNADAWLEVMHFEKMTAPTDDFGEEPDDMMGPEGLDPASLITVIEALAHLTDGLPIDPEAGEVLV
ncbi:MAG: hypothetical protein AAF266_12785 [Planctomycetota bacterium]